MKSVRENGYLRQLVDIQYELYAYVTALTGGTADAEDVLQNTNARIMELVTEVTPLEISHFRAWAKKVAFFQVLTWRKRNQRERVCFDSELVETLAEQLADRPYASEERMEALRHCLNKLPPTLRAMTEERYRTGGCVKRIAEKLRTTPHAITMNLYRARLMLKQCVEKTLASGGPYG
ncbi:MAG TPA: sigma-70 family RNA polymerase sigma factor [Kiritimatiellia bacterium]|nr:sigma-70 family RNA polymerase sigma factor [Kiritimatiellia bacterium]